MNALSSSSENGLSRSVLLAFRNHGIHNGGHSIGVVDSGLSDHYSHNVCFSIKKCALKSQNLPICMLEDADTTDAADAVSLIFYFEREERGKKQYANGRQWRQGRQPL